MTLTRIVEGLEITDPALKKKLEEAARGLMEAHGLLSNERELCDFPWGIPKYVDFKAFSSRSTSEINALLKKSVMLKQLKNEGIFNAITRVSKLSSPITDKQKKMLFLLSKREGRHGIIQSANFDWRTLFLDTFDAHFITPYLNNSKYRFTGNHVDYAMSIKRETIDVNSLNKAELHLYCSLLMSRDAFAPICSLLEPMILDIWREIADAGIDIKDKKNAVNAFFGLASYIDEPALIILLGVLHRDIYEHYLGDSLYNISGSLGDIEMTPFSECFEGAEAVYNKYQCGLKDAVLTASNNVAEAFGGEHFFGLNSKTADCGFHDVKFVAEYLRNRSDFLLGIISDAEEGTYIDSMTSQISDYRSAIANKESVLSGHGIILPDDERLLSCVLLAKEINRESPRLNIFLYLSKSLEKAFKALADVSSSITQFDIDVSKDRDALVKLSADPITNIAKITALSESISRRYDAFVGELSAFSYSIDDASLVALEHMSSKKIVVDESALPPGIGLLEGPDLESCSNQIMSLEASLIEAESNLEKSERSKSEIQYKLEQMEAAITAERNELAAIKISKAKDGMFSHIREIMAKIISNPSKCSLEDQLTAMSSLYPDSVVVLPEAVKSAKLSDYINLGLAWVSLQKLCCEYLPAINSGKPDSEAKAIFPIKVFSANESLKARAPGAERDARTGVYLGKKYIFDKHLRLGWAEATTKTLRIHFDVIDGKLVIFHCGKHLD